MGVSRRLPGAGEVQTEGYSPLLQSGQLLPQAFNHLAAVGWSKRMERSGNRRCSIEPIVVLVNQRLERGQEEQILRSSLSVGP